MRTVETLFEVITYNDWDYLDFPCMVDYFGLHNASSEENIQTLLGLYIGLVKRNVTKDQLHEALVNSQIGELIDKTYKGSETGYYKLYKDNNIKI